MYEQLTKFNTNFVVIAGAGSGKTKCLINTYINLLEGIETNLHLNPEQIVAITFTDKAANEMRRRIQTEITERIQKKDTNLNWSSLLISLELAPICTIHSFCVKILKEFAPLLGLDPEFVVLDEQEFNILLQQTIADLCRTWIKEGEAILIRVMTQYNLTELANLLKTLYQRLIIQGISPESAQAATILAHEVPFANAINLVTNLEKNIQELNLILRKNQKILDKKYGQKILELIRQWTLFGSQLKTNPISSMILAKLTPLVNNNWYTLNKFRQEICEDLNQLVAFGALPAAASLANDILSLANRVVQTIKQKMWSLGALSFDQLLVSVSSLFNRHNQALNELQNRYKALLVDEFQDVNPIQNHIIMLLSGLNCKKNNSIKTNNNMPKVLLVGDPKQSIYAFRGADINIFSQAITQIIAEGGQTAFLLKNFRSSHSLVNFFNKIIEKIFFSDELIIKHNNFDLNFSKHELQIPTRTNSFKLTDSIQLLDCRTLIDKNESLASWRKLEAQAIATHLVNIIALNTATVSDVAILFRRLTQVEIYEQALSEANIPYYTVRSRAFYACQEIIDISLALRSILIPDDNLALAGFLRSSLVGLNNDSLLALCYSEKGTFTSLDKAFNSTQPLPKWLGIIQQNRLERSRELIKKLRHLARRLTPVELLECLVEYCDLIPLWQATPFGEQKIANLHKLIESARQYSQVETVEIFAANLARLVTNPPDDPQAQSFQKSSAVQLMSVHQAKGLQFPIVILPDLSTLPPPSSKVTLSVDGIFGVILWDPIRGQKIKTPVYNYIKEEQKKIKQAEAARLFYVACTRAQEQLIFCLNGIREQYQGIWAKWVRELVLKSPTTRIISINNFTKDIKKDLFTPHLSVALAKKNWLNFLPSKPGSFLNKGVKLVTNILHPHTPPPIRIRESVSGLEAWLECPRLWYFTHKLKLNITELEINPNKTTKPIKYKIQLGALVHRILELTDLDAGVKGLEATIAQVTHEFILSKNLIYEAFMLTKSLWDTDLPSWLTGAKQILREHPFYLFIDNNPKLEMEIYGKFDLLANISKNSWLLVDYKVTPKIYPKKYRTQMALYALALWRSQDKIVSPLRIILCYLNAKGCQLIEFSFTSKELKEWETTILEIGHNIISVVPFTNYLDLPSGRHCQHTICILSRAGFCPSFRGIV